MSESGVCQVCASDEKTSIFLELDDCLVSRCSECGFVYLGGRREVEEEHERYDKDQYTDGYMQHFDVKKIVEEQLGSLRSIVARAGGGEGIADMGVPVLDIGCGRGFYLNCMREAGWSGELVGVDISKHMTAWGRDEFGLDLRGVPIEEAGLPKGHFGLVTSWDVIEHLPHPDRALAEILEYLKPGAWCAIEVPSEKTLFRILARAAYRLSGGKLRKFAARLYHPTHLSYFTEGSLRRLLESLGAERITMVTKEAHVTRFGISRYRQPARAAIRLVSILDRMFGMEAKLLCAFRKPLD